MKRWQIEQILYLNDFGKRKLVWHTLDQQHNISAMPVRKENFALNSLRKVCTFFLNIL